MQLGLGIPQFMVFGIDDAHIFPVLIAERKSGNLIKST